MKQYELLEILDSNKKLSITDVKKILYTLKQDAYNEINCHDAHMNTETFRWYCGEINGFQIALDLLEKVGAK